MHNKNLTKGQIFSKGLFDIVEFFQKTNEKIRESSKNEFGRIWGHQKTFRNYLTFNTVIKRVGSTTLVNSRKEDWVALVIV